MTATYDAVLFDLDGVLTSTAALHASCWQRVFDEALVDWTRRTGEPQEPFGEADYLAHVDGKPRHDGVRDFLRARGIDGDVDAIADHKQALVERELAEGAVEAFPGSVGWVLHLRRAGVRTAVVSSSANCTDVLRAAGISTLFDLTVDGADIVEVVEVDMTHEATTYRLVEGRGLVIGHFDEPLRLLPDEPVSCPQPDELRRAA
jgi:alpha,alpha-trehalose phosphorylase